MLVSSPISYSNKTLDYSHCTYAHDGNQSIPARFAHIEMAKDDDWQARKHEVSKSGVSCSSLVSFKATIAKIHTALQIAQVPLILLRPAMPRRLAIPQLMRRAALPKCRTSDGHVDSQDAESEDPQEAHPEFLVRATQYPEQCSDDGKFREHERKVAECAGESQVFANDGKVGWRHIVEMVSEAILRRDEFRSCRDDAESL